MTKIFLLYTLHIYSKIKYITKFLKILNPFCIINTFMSFQKQELKKTHPKTPDTLKNFLSVLPHQPTSHHLLISKLCPTSLVGLFFLLFS